jgi:hypothetical protein
MPRASKPGAGRLLRRMPSGAAVTARVRHHRRMDLAPGSASLTAFVAEATNLSAVLPGYPRSLGPSAWDNAAMARSIAVSTSSNALLVTLNVWSCAGVTDGAPD